MAIDIKFSCVEDIGRFGLKGCQKALGSLARPILFQKGIKLNLLTDTLDQAKIDELIQTDKMKVLPKGTFTSAAEEDVFETQGNSGEQSFVRAGLFGGDFTFTKGGTCLSNALATLRNGNWDMFLVGSNGDVAMEVTNDGYIKGFSTSHVSKGTTVYNDGSTSTKYSAKFQLDVQGSKAFNTAIKVFTPEVDFLGLDGVNDSTIEFISATATEVKVKVNVSCDGTTEVPNLEAKFFLTKVADGSTSTPAATYDAGTKIYTIPLTAAGAYKLDIKDGTKQVVKDVEGYYYAAKEITFTA